MAKLSNQLIDHKRCALVFDLRSFVVVAAL